MRGTAEQFYRKFDDATRAMAAFNGAGVAGVIGLMQRPGPTPLPISLAGISFIVGILGAMAMWIFIGLPPISQHEKETEAAFSKATLALFCSTGAFLYGVIMAFVGTWWN